MDAAPTTELSLRRAVDFIPGGLAVYDADLKLVTCNIRYRELLDLPAPLCQAGTPLYDLALFVSRRGDLGPGDPMQLAAERIETLTSASGSVTQRLGKQGQTLEFHSARRPDGGIVISFADVSQRVDAEAALEAFEALGIKVVRASRVPSDECGMVVAGVPIGSDEYICATVKCSIEVITTAWSTVRMFSRHRDCATRIPILSNYCYIV